MILHEPTQLAGLDLTSPAALLGAGWDATRTTYVVLDITLGSLDAGASTFTVWVYRNGMLHGEASGVAVKSSGTSYAFASLPLFVAAGNTITATVESNNASDSSGITADVMILDAMVASDVTRISASSAAADGVAANIANLDATISSRATPTSVAEELATYDGPTRAEATADKDEMIAALPTEPDNAGIASIQERTQHIPDAPAEEAGVAAVQATADSIDAKLTSARAAALDNLDGPVSDSQTAAQAAADKAAILAAISAAAPAGDGDTTVNHDTGGEDNLRIVDGDGAGVDNVAIRAYLKTEYDANPATAVLRAGPIYTAADGRWVGTMLLNSGLVYTLVYARPGYNAVTKEVTVS